MATDITTLTAAQVHPVFGRFSMMLTPKIPPYSDNAGWEPKAERVCEEQGSVMEVMATPAEAWIAFNAIRVAVNSEVLSHVDHIVGMYVLQRLPEAMIGDDSIHAAVDVLARIDWIIDHLQEFGINTEDAIPILRRVRSDAWRLMPEKGVIVDPPRATFGGPTVGEVAAVEKAFAKVGLPTEAAHEAVGLSRRSKAEA